jgi:hypothetical protein
MTRSTWLSESHPGTSTLRVSGAISRSYRRLSRHRPRFGEKTVTTLVAGSVTPSLEVGLAQKRDCCGKLQAVSARAARRWRVAL